jgi:hypothetical protein
MSVTVFTPEEIDVGEILFVQDPKGYFIIHIRDRITVEHYTNDRKPGIIIVGDDAESIWYAIFKHDLVSRLDHAYYLGNELFKAEFCLKHKFTYIQDKPLLEIIQPTIEINVKDEKKE